MSPTVVAEASWSIWALTYRSTARAAGEGYGEHDDNDAGLRAMVGEADMSGDASRTMPLLLALLPTAGRLHRALDADASAPAMQAFCSVQGLVLRPSIVDQAAIALQAGVQPLNGGFDGLCLAVARPAH